MAPVTAFAEAFEPYMAAVKGNSSPGCNYPKRRFGFPKRLFGLKPV